MCGLVGLYSSDFSLRHKDCLNSLLFFDTLRGRDSTGVAAIRHNADTEVMKSTVPGCDFVDDPRFQKFLSLLDFCWIGHNRYGTVGKNIKTNAHPFMIEDEDGACILVGAHNGTLRNKWALANHADFGTDSEALYNQIALTGLEDAISKIEGAWALTYYDHLQEELRFLRNKERPLFYAFEEDKRTLIWASEIWMIRVAAARCNIKLLDDSVHSFEEDHLYSCEVVLQSKQELIFEKKGAVVGKQPTAFFQGQTGGAETDKPKTTKEDGKKAATSLTESGTLEQKATETQTLTSRMLLGKQTPEKDNVVSIGLYKGYKGEPISYADLKKQLDRGCAWCGDAIPLKAIHAWIGKEKPVCGHCLLGNHHDTVLEDEKTVLSK